jgi:isovaleryl-CoA dehydrogenase
MIDVTQFGFADEYQQIYDTVYRYSREELHPLMDRMDRDDWFPEERFRSLHEVGLLGLTVPGEYDGQGLDFLAQCFAGEAMAYWNHIFCAAWLSSENICIDNIVRNGNDEQKRNYLPRFCDGSAIGAMGMTEPGAGSDALGSMRTTARKIGSGYVLNGRKMFISNAPVADIVVVYAKTDPDRGHHGISAFIVEKNFPGFSAAQKLDKMGWRGSPTGELVFEDCEVPAENLMGSENSGVAVMMSGLNVERLVLCFYNLGIAQRALDLSVEYAKTREQFNQPIGQFQLVQAMLADMYTDVETMRAFTYQTARQLFIQDPSGMSHGELQKRCAAAYLHTGRATMRVLDNGVQIHGGMGFMRESEINQLYRCGKLLEIGGGTVQIRQLIIGSELVK